jgi:Family of unknown function (DUF6785)/Domain of unknown function (DUF6784)
MQMSREPEIQLTTVAGGDAPDVLPLGRPARAITFRSILTGTLAVAATCLLTTYNDHVVVNTFFIGSYFPLALVLTIFLVVVVGNSALYRLLPRHALTPPELSVVILMTVLGCGIPAQGLFRFFLPMLLGPFKEGSTNTRFWQAFTGAGLPDWLFPVPSIAEGRNHPFVNTFLGRVQPGEAVPYHAWYRPFAAWGVFLVGWMTCLLSMMWIFRRQWAVNERLPFPLASIEASLIAQPKPGRMLNDLLGSRLFWTGVIVVFLLQSNVGLNRYFPKTVPLIPLKYDLGGIMGNEPWKYFAWYVKSATVYFTFIGIAYFIQSRISFSLWATFLIAQVATVQQRMFQSDISDDAWRDQHLGATLAFTAGFLWIGRHHIVAVGRQLIGRPGGTTLTAHESYRPAALLFLMGLLIMALWLLFMQVQWWVMAAMLAMILISHLVTARIVAETGLPFVRCDLTAYQMYSNLPAKWLTSRDVFFSGMMYVLGPVSTRESAAVYGQQGLVLADASQLDTARHGRRLAGVIAWTILVAFAVSFFATLWTHYTYATPITTRVQHAVLDPPAMDRPRTEVVDPMVRQAEGTFTSKNYSPGLHVSLGIGVTAALQVLALRSASWPLLPVGYLLCTRWFIGLAWFSLFLGWLAKVLILKYGGASMYQKARPLFIGLIFGEALAAGVWMLISLALAWSGLNYQSVPMLPQ